MFTQEIQNPECSCTYRRFAELNLPPWVFLFCCAHFGRKITVVAIFCMVPHQRTGVQLHGTFPRPRARFRRWPCSVLDRPNVEVRLYQKAVVRGEEDYPPKQTPYTFSRMAEARQEAPCFSRHRHRCAQRAASQQATISARC